MLAVSSWDSQGSVSTDGDGSARLHPVLHNALAAACPPPVAVIIRDWSHRDPVDAMLDARLLRQAIVGADTDLNRPEVSYAARRAYSDWMRDYSQEERIDNAGRLAAVLTEWADTVLDEAINELR